MAEPPPPRDLIDRVLDHDDIEWSRVDDGREPDVRRHVRLLDQLRRAAERERNVRTSRGEGPRSWVHLRDLTPIGRGAWSVVHRAWDPRLKRHVALKLLEPREELTVEDTRVVQATLLAEGRRLARLRHPNVVGVHGADEESGRAGLWMELIDGSDLETELSRRGPLSAQEAAIVGMAVATAMAAVHAAGLVHRDIKCANVMRERGGRIVLMDFGTGADAMALRRDRLLAGSGTPMYMAPNVLEGGIEGPRSDIYSLGVTLFRLATGAYPHEASTVDELRASHATGKRRSLLDLRPELSPGFVAAVDRMLARDPGDRFETAGQVATALRRTLTEASTAAPSTTSRGAFLRGGLAGAMVAASLAMLWLAWRHGDATSAPAGPLMSLVATAVITETPLEVSSPARVRPVVSPDGTRIAFGTGDHIVVRRLDRDAPDRILRDIRWVCDWTPDGASLLAVLARDDGGTDLALVDLESGTRTRLVENARDGDLSQDGRRLLYVSTREEPDRGLWLLDRASGAQRRIISPRSAGGFVLEPHWSPDESRISFVRLTGQTTSLWVCDADGSNDHSVAFPFLIGPGGTWTHDGSALLVSAQSANLNNLWRVSLSGHDRAQLTGSWSGYAYVAGTPDPDRFVGLRGYDLSRIVLVDRGSGATTSPFSARTGMRNPSFTPDGEGLVAQVLVDDRWEIWRGDLTTGEMVPLVARAERGCVEPSVSRDDGRIYHLVASARSVALLDGPINPRRLHVASDDGRKSEEFDAVGHRVRSLPPTPVRHGRLLAVRDSESSAPEIVVVSPGQAPISVLTYSGLLGFYGVDWGADTTSVVVSHTLPGGSTFSAISAVDLATGSLTRWIDLPAMAGDGHDVHPTGSIWALALRSDGAELAFVAPADGVTTLFVLDVASGSVEQLFAFDRLVVVENLAWSQDGSTVAVEVGDVRQSLVFLEPEPASGLGAPREPLVRLGAP